MKTIKLSVMNPNLDFDEVVNFLLDNGYDGIQNDVQGVPYINYDFSEMYEYWNGLRELING
jgi:hypothetical protein